MSPLPPPAHQNPDESVRVAWAHDAEAIAALQLAAWPELYGDVVDASAMPSDTTAFADAWRTSLSRPADARMRVLVALDAGAVVGMAVTSPSPDPDADPIADGELSELIVARSHRGQGHGSRLMQAAVDTLRQDRFQRATAWVRSTDDDVRRFLSSAGWAPDGAHRELEAHAGSSQTLKQVRLHTAIAAAAQPQS